MYEFIKRLVFFVNGSKIIDDRIDPSQTLLFYLRNTLGLTGSKLGCGEGGCGACTVMVSYFNHSDKQLRHISVNACLTPICAVHGMAVTTVEGIGSTKTKLHAVQERIAKSHGSQCGFCTPGIVMSMYALLRNNNLPSEEDLEVAFQGNLCRCTGYRPILDGFRTLTRDYQCCKGKGSDGCCMVNSNGNECGLSRNVEFTPYDKSKEMIFPTELQMSDEYNKEFLKIGGSGITWYRPVTLDQLLELKHLFNKAKLVVGNTEIGLEVKFKHCDYPELIYVSSIPQLCGIVQCEDGIKIGSSCTLSDIENRLKVFIYDLPKHKTKVLIGIVEMLKWFAGLQIRNVASIGGNIITASPISDLVPILMAAGAHIEICSKTKGTRTALLDQSFFKGYRQIDITGDEVLVNIFIPFTSTNNYFKVFKQARRREDDIAIVNAGFMAHFATNSNVINSLSIAFGGMAPTTVLANKTMTELQGHVWNEEMFRKACNYLIEDLPLPAGSPGGMEEYRRTLCLSFFFKFYLHVKKQLEELYPHLYPSKIPTSYLTAIGEFEKHVSKSSQIFQESDDGDGVYKPVGKAFTHLSATKHATGEAKYVDDIPHYEGEVYLALLTSSKAHAKICKIDPSKALEVKGVHCYIDHKDVPGKNNFGEIQTDDVIFATNTVTCYGQVIGGIAADTQEIAQKAARLVVVDYEELPSIITNEQAIDAEQFYPFVKSIKKGDVDNTFAICDHIVEGEVKTGAQEHFYLETNGTIAVPKGEDGEMELYVSTQNLANTQTFVARALGVPSNRINVRTKRIGGGFGGKETRHYSVALAACVAAHKLNKPVRCILDRDEDMTLTGTRHPFLGKYKVGCTKDGKLLAARIILYANAGCTVDLSPGVLEKAIFHVTNAYYIPNVHVTGYCCKTNIPSNTAFRGFGAPQGMFVCETWMGHIALELNIPCNQIRELNLFREGDITHYNQVIEHCTLERCWNSCLEQSNFYKRQRVVKKFNSENRWKKRGLSIVPTIMGLTFTAKQCNQAGCLVNIYTDGSVLLAHGGVEMGQGLHTKMVQIAAQTLNIPLTQIHVSETNTSIVPNAISTAASVSSDLNGFAIKNACEDILQRLEPYRKQKPDGSWTDWVKAAYYDRTSLSTTGFYKTPDIGYDIETNSGKLYNYFTYGVACSEVQVDCLTGDHIPLKTDIVMDLGKSLNPAIDIGQIEGAYIQGYGLFTMEEQLYQPNGYLLTRGPSNYKIPGFNDIPAELNVTLLKGSGNPRAVFSSKGVGEPPLFLGSSALFAINDAIMSARKEVGLTGMFRLDAPATAERIRMACVDEFTDKFPKAADNTQIPWTVTL